jgi:hypothetical protein
MTEISACLVTRGNLDMTLILQSILTAGIDDVRIWNNALEHDEAVYGRYRAVEQARHQIIYSQDDDCVVPPGTILALIAAHEPGTITANMPLAFHPHYPDSCLLGFGSVFDRDAPERAFRRFEAYHRKRYQLKDRRIRPDVIFTALTPHRKVVMPFENLSAATAPDRMYMQRGHARERDRVLRMARRAR